MTKTVSHLIKFKTQLESRAQFRQRSDLQWFEMEQPVSPEKFESLKIISPAMSDISNFYFDQHGLYCFNSVQIIRLKDSRKENYLFVTGLLNSKPLEFYLRSYSPYLQAKYYSYEVRYLSKLPIKLPATPEEKKLAKQIEQKVERILALMEAAPKERADIAAFAGETEELARSELVEKRLTGRPLEEPRASGKRVLLNEHDAIVCKDATVARYLHTLISSRLGELAAARDLADALNALPVPRTPAAAKQALAAWRKAEEAAAESPAEVKQLEAEIDELVYQLYGLSQADRKLIEDAIKR